MENNKNNKMLKLSIIIPVYNGKKFLKTCFKNILRQTYSNIEIIFVDDASTDGGDKLILDFAKNKDFVKVIKNEKNLGIFISRFKGLELATGDIIAFLDCDDYFDKNYYEILIENMLKINADIVISDFVNSTEQNNITKKEDFILQGEQCFNFFCTKESVKEIYNQACRRIVKKELYYDCKDIFKILLPRAENIVGGEDTIYTMVLVSRAKCISFCFEAKYIYYRHNDQSVCIDNKEKLFTQILSRIRSMQLIKGFLQIEGLMDKYQYIYDTYLVSLKNKFLSDSFKYNCVKECIEVLKKYNM